MCLHIQDWNHRTQHLNIAIRNIKTNLIFVLPLFSMILPPSTAIGINLTCVIFSSWSVSEWSLCLCSVFTCLKDEEAASDFHQTTSNYSNISLLIVMNFGGNKPLTNFLRLYSLMSRSTDAANVKHILLF